MSRSLSMIIFFSILAMILVFAELESRKTNKKRLEIIRKKIEEREKEVREKEVRKSKEAATKEK